MKLDDTIQQEQPSMGFGAKGAAGDPKPQMFDLGFGAKGAAGDPKPQMFDLAAPLGPAKVAWERPMLVKMGRLEDFVQGLGKGGSKFDMDPGMSRKGSLG